MSDRRVPLILAIFLLSGAAGLIYEIVWSRQLVLVFGNTTQAVSAILTGFFGGMAIGAAVGGRVADRVRSPLRMYGILELVLVVVVLVTPITFRLIHELYRGVYPSLEGTPWLAVVRLFLAVLALAPATILMGATFPSLTRYLARSSALSQVVRAAVCREHDRGHRRHGAGRARPDRAVRPVGRARGRCRLLRHRRPGRDPAVARDRDRTSSPIRGRDRDRAAGDAPPRTTPETDRAPSRGDVRPRASGSPSSSPSCPA